MKFDIIIVSWQNYDLLQFTLNSVKKNSRYIHDIYIHINSCERSYKRCVDQGYTTYYSNVNEGLCWPANKLAYKGKNDYVCFVDDDMYLLPNWDSNLIKFKGEHGIPDRSWLCSTMIEPQGQNSVVTSKYGTNLSTFKEEELLRDFENGEVQQLPPVVNNSSTPLLLHRELLRDCRGYDEEVGSVIGAELGLAKRCWDAGCRDFVQVPDSMCFHFSSQSTSKLKDRQKLGKQRDDSFLSRYNITRQDFCNNILQKGKTWPLT